MPGCRHDGPTGFLRGGVVPLRKRGCLVVVAVVALAVLAGGLWLRGKMIAFETKLNAIQIRDVDLSQVADGTYTGAADAEIIRAEVKVTMRDNMIKGIELVRHDTGRGQDAKAIPDRVVAAQSLHVDVITGATYSSKVILKAIENALTGR